MTAHYTEIGIEIFFGNLFWNHNQNLKKKTQKIGRDVCVK